MREKKVLRMFKLLIGAITGVIVVPFTEAERVGEDKLEAGNRPL